MSTEGWMEDVVAKRSKLEQEKELISKKRTYSEFIGGEEQAEKGSKRRKVSSSQVGFMEDVVMRKSKLELEKEASLREKLQEKENQLKSTQKDLVMKFEVPVAKSGSNSISP